MRSKAEKKKTHLCLKSCAKVTERNSVRAYWYYWFQYGVQEEGRKK